MSSQVCLGLFKFQRYCNTVSEWRRPALRLGRVAIPNQADSGRSGRLRLQRHRLRQRLGRSRRVLPIAGTRHRAAVWLRLPPQRESSRLHQSQGLRRICRLGSAHRLEHMADICHLTRSCASASPKPDDHEIAAERIIGSSMPASGPKAEITAQKCHFGGRLNRSTQYWRLISLLGFRIARSHVVVRLADESPCSDGLASAPTSRCPRESTVSASHWCSRSTRVGVLLICGRCSPIRRSAATAFGRD